MNRRNLFENTAEQIELKQIIAKFRGCSMEKMLSFPSKQMRTQENVEEFVGHSLYKLFLTTKSAV